MVNFDTLSWKGDKCSNASNRELSRWSYAFVIS
jgi:hypothetical protein